MLTTSGRSISRGLTEDLKREIDVLENEILAATANAPAQGAELTHSRETSGQLLSGASSAEERQIAMIEFLARGGRRSHASSGGAGSRAFGSLTGEEAAGSSAATGMAVPRVDSTGLPLAVDAEPKAPISRPTPVKSAKSVFRVADVQPRVVTPTRQRPTRSVFTMDTPPNENGQSSPSSREGG